MTSSRKKLSLPQRFVDFVLIICVFLILKFKIFTGFFLDFLFDIIQLPLFQAKRLRVLILLSMRLTEHHLVTFRRHLELATGNNVLHLMLISYLLKRSKEHSWYQWLWSWRFAIATLKNAAEVPLPPLFSLLEFTLSPLFSLLELARVPPSSLFQSLHIQVDRCFADHL